MVPVFYAVVCDDNTTKKSYRQKFTHFVNISYKAVSPTLELSNTPALFKTKEEAQSVYRSAVVQFKETIYKDKPLTHSRYEFEIQPFRLTESDYMHGNEEDNRTRIRDARRVAFGMMHYDGIAEQVKKLAGKILTILDAAYVNENQNKAVKDLVKSSFRSQLGDIHTKAYEDPDSESCEGANEKDILD
jgi:hypothetical protein